MSEKLTELARGVASIRMALEEKEVMRELGISEIGKASVLLDDLALIFDPNSEKSRIKKLRAKLDECREMIRQLGGEL